MDQIVDESKGAPDVVERLIHCIFELIRFIDFWPLHNSISGLRKKKAPNYNWTISRIELFKYYLRFFLKLFGIYYFRFLLLMK